MSKKQKGRELGRVDDKNKKGGMDKKDTDDSHDERALGAHQSPRRTRLSAREERCCYL